MAGFNLTIKKEEIQLVERFYCLRCLLILKEAVQTDKGDRFCSSCFQVAANCDDFKDKFPASQWFPDKGIRREVNRLPVKCQNECFGCKWTGILIDHEVSSLQLCRLYLTDYFCLPNCLQSFHKDRCEYRQTSFVICSVQYLALNLQLACHHEEKQCKNSIVVPYTSTTVESVASDSDQWIFLKCITDWTAIGHCIYSIQFRVRHYEKVIVLVECILKTWRVPVFFLSQLSTKRDASTERIISNYLHNVFNGPSLIECRLLPLLKLAVARDESVCVYSTPASSFQILRRIHNTVQLNKDELHLMTASSSDDDQLNEDDSPLISQFVSGIQSGVEDLILSSFFPSFLLRAESSDEEEKPHNAVCRFDRAEYIVYNDSEKDLTVATASIGVKDTTTMLSEYLPTSKSKEAEAVYAYECDVEYTSNNDQNYEFVV